MCEVLKKNNKSLLHVCGKGWKVMKRCSVRKAQKVQRELSFFNTCMFCFKQFFSHDQRHTTVDAPLRK